MEDYDQAILLNPRSDWAYTNRAYCRTFQNQWEEAFANVNTALTIAPKNSWALCSKVCYWWDPPDATKRDPAEARKLAKQANELEREKDWEPWALLAAIHAELGEWKDAVNARLRR